MSLIELALVMVIISLALAPVVQNIGGVRSNSGNGTADRVIGLKSKELILANTLVESALSGDYSSFGCGTKNPFDPMTGFPGPGQTLTIPASRCQNAVNYATPLYYQWTVHNMDQTGQQMPVGNHYYTAVLNVWDSSNSQTPMLTLPTAFYQNTGNGNSANTKTGLMVVLDISGSMTSGSNNNKPWDNSTGVASPYLLYRFKDPVTGFTPNPAIQIGDGDIYKNKNLDIVSLLAADDPNTEWDDRFLRPVSTPPINNPDMRVPLDCGTNHNFSSSIFDANSLSDTSGPPGRDERTVVNNLCSVTGGPTTYGGQPTSPTWGNTLNDNLSRIEAARSSLLTFLIDMEGNPDLYQSVNLGFITFSTPVTDRVVPLEPATGNSYINMRRAFTWINRKGPGIIPASGSTNMYGAIQRGADILYADSSLQSRIMFFVGDGEPTVGPQDHASFQSLATAIGNGTYPGSKGNKITVFTLGVLNQSPNLQAYLRDDIPYHTPGGAYFFAQNVQDMQPMFNQIGYQIQRIVLLNKSNRYYINFT